MAGMRYSRGLGGGAGWSRVQLPDGRNVTIKGDRATRNNNPGNIEAGPFARRHGAIGTDGRFAIFGTRQAGMRAQSALLFGSRDYRNLTLAEAIASYAPEFENNTAAYAAAVSAATGIPLDTKMSDIPENMRESVVTAMHQVESGNRPTARVFDDATGVHIGTIDPRFANTPEFGAPTPYGPNDVLANAPTLRPDNPAYGGPAGRFTVDRAPSIASFGGMPTPGLSSGFLDRGVPMRSVQTTRVPGQFDAMPPAASNFGLNHGPAGAVAGLTAQSVRSVSYGLDGAPRRSSSALDGLGFATPSYAASNPANAPRLGGGLMDPLGSLGPGVSPSYAPARTLSGFSDVRPMPSGPIGAPSLNTPSPSAFADAYSQYGSTLDQMGVRLDGTATMYEDPIVSVVNPPNPNRVSTMPRAPVVRQAVPAVRTPPVATVVPPTATVAPVYTPPSSVAPVQESGFPAAPPAPQRPSIADVYAGAPGVAISNAGIEVSRAPGGFIDRYNPEYDITTVETPQGYQAGTLSRGRLNRTDQARSLLGAKSLSSRAMKNVGGTLLGGILGGAVAGPAGGILGGFLGNQLARGNTFRGILGGILGDGFLGGDYPARPDGGVISNGPGLSRAEMREISPSAARAVSKGKAGLY